MKNNTKKILTGVTGAAMLLTGCAQQTPSADQAVIHTAAENQEDVLQAVAGEAVTDFVAVPNVRASFQYSQDVVTPADEIFNLFGTAVTAACAKPSFALEGDATYFINVGGEIQQDYTFDLKEAAKNNSQTMVMSCACATGAAVANAEITGVAVKDVLQLAEAAPEVNTITVRGSDGYGMSLPLSYALEKNAMIVYKINGEDVPSGTQLWVPETVAKYFTRSVVDIELSAEETVPVVEGADEQFTARVDILNHADDESFNVGDSITFEGYADDCGSPIECVEFSMDGGETWTVFRMEDTTADKWVYWYYTFVPEQPGTYKLNVRARTAEGRVSPLGATVVFNVYDAE